MSSFCADEVLSVEALVSGVDEAQRVLGGLEIKAFCKSLQRSADLAEMRVRVAALDAETDHHVRWNLLLKKLVTLDPHRCSSERQRQAELEGVRPWPSFASLSRCARTAVPSVHGAPLLSHTRPCDCCDAL